MRHLLKRPRPLTFYLAALCVALTVPTLSVIGLMTWRFAESEKARLENDVNDINRGIVFDLERQHSADMAMLSTLATTPALRDGDFESFKAQAQALIAMHFHNAHIVLYSRDGFQVLLDVGKTLNGERLPPPVKVLGQDISNLERGATFWNSTYSITVPVVIDGSTRFYLSGRLPLTRLARIIREQNLSVGHFVSIVDRNGIILARSAENESRFGQRIPGVADDAPDHFDWTGVNPQGVSVYGVFRRLNFGWGVTTGVSQSLLHSPLRASLQWLALLAAVMIAAGAAAAWFITRIMARAVQTLEHKAHKLGDGEPIASPVTPITEANAIGQALAEASQHIREQAEALHKANVELEQRVAQRTSELAEKTSLLETTLSHMDQGLVVTDQNRRIQLWNARTAELLGLPPDVLVQGAEISMTVGFQMRRGDFIGTPDDVAIMYASALPPRQTLVHERERADGTVLEIRTVPLPDGRLVRTYTDVTLRKHAERHLQHLARHDSLTGLPNRVLLHEQLEKAIAMAQRHGIGFAVLALDLDHFKDVNDALGHAAGDRLLVDVAGRLKGVLRMEDTVARLGGDEFTIIQAATGGIGPADLAQRVLDAVSRRYTVDDTAFDIELSIGVALWTKKMTTPDDILKCADDALYRAKRLGRNRFCVTAPARGLRRAG
ncbi:MAG: diguanylate cyclase/phosphodiesterase (GGDEF & EAL domains) with PAS/PAC sensor(s) [Pseudolabrys sp.]|nr:diguanylate cyclase/phosphodiesterase (GGDEF & EAL domains) with PAS/PAC sensor(s) [Pseudolabrys sp.]